MVHEKVNKNVFLVHTNFKNFSLWVYRNRGFFYRYSHCLDSSGIICAWYKSLGFYHPDLHHKTTCKYSKTVKT